MNTLFPFKFSEKNPWCFYNVSNNGYFIVSQYGRAAGEKNFVQTQIPWLLIVLMFFMTLILFLLPRDLESPGIYCLLGNEVPCWMRTTSTPISNSSAGVSRDMSLENNKCEESDNSNNGELIIKDINNYIY